jgi:hypothetical protein
MHVFRHRPWTPWAQPHVRTHKHRSEPRNPGLLPRPEGVRPNRGTATYPLVTTGGGALPLPTYCAQPAMLRRANTAAVARASFFIAVTFP